ncbi:PF03235 family protein [Propionibacterium freudenreichii]|nr:PF03235 family protein [Propionibacterium freudenreichii]SCQ80069.1 PF03235 family protein [Propionibacterium freudenreichii]
MPYLPDTTIAATLREVVGGDLVLPAIQREFVWRPEQVVRLFDSVMRGYPIGSFLSWKVSPETAKQFKFYGFLRRYSEFDSRHNPQLDLLPSRDVIAVLDGQQRLTSLNIGLRGSFAWKRKYTHSRFRENFPERTLYLNLAGKAPENAAGLEYDFRWLEAGHIDSMEEGERAYWLSVPTVYESSTMRELWRELGRRGLANEESPADLAQLLWERVHSHNSIQFFQETDQDIERVLDIFIRVNSGGTVLAYSDLLLSIATAQWKDRDARQEVHGLVDELNAVGAGFSFSKDLILKSGLVLSGIPDIGFKVKNFTTENMAKLADQWDEIAASLRVAVGLFSDFGLSGATLSANSVLIPVALYLHHRRATQTYREDPRMADERAAIKNWVLRSLIIPGVWGSGLDVLLRAIRDVIEQSAARGFPVADLERVMASRGKSLRGNDEVVDGLLYLRYGDPRTFPLLALMFDHVNTRNQHHVDHVYPTAQLKPGVLRDAGVGPDERALIVDRKDRLPNLELLEGLENISKSAKFPAEWVAEAMPDESSRTAYIRRNLLPPTLPATLADFDAFYQARRDLLRARLRELLGVRRDEEVNAKEGSLPALDEAMEAEVRL